MNRSSNIILIQPWFVYHPQNNLPYMFKSFQTSIFDTKNNIILFFGGQEQRNFTEVSEDITFDYITIFDMSNNNWMTKTSRGDTIPTTRGSHTTTLGNHMKLFCWA